ARQSRCRPAAARTTNAPPDPRGVLPEAPPKLNSSLPDPNLYQPVMQPDAAAMFDDDQPEWLSQSAPVDDDMTAEPAGDMPDWLSQMEPAAEPQPQQHVM